jgi:TonB-linked SusC/RagA family outer membrane protein
MNNIYSFLFLLAFLFSSALSEAQNSRIRGTVSHGETGQPVSGASVIVKGTTLGTITNTDGEYQIDMPAGNNMLSFSFSGLRTLDLPVTGPVVNATLYDERLQIEEVMVVAYGTSVRETFTGSASVISGPTLRNQQSTSLSKALQGLASGLETTTGHGQPGEEAAMRIRGISTLGDASPLVVLDGFPYTGKLSSIPARDIESVTILKDAPATALYGSRASNGVIIITTRKGEHEKTGLSVNVQYGLSDRAMPEYNRVTPDQWYELMWETMVNTRMSQGKMRETAAAEASSGLIAYIGGYNAYNVADNLVVGTDGKVNPEAQLIRADDWQNEMFRTGHRKDVSIDAHGGNSNTSYFASAGMVRDEGILNASDFNRYHARLNVSSRINDRISLDMNLSGSIADQNYPVSSGNVYSNPFRFTRFIAPVYPVYLYDQEGNRMTEGEGIPLYDFGTGAGKSRPFGPNTNPVGTTVLDTRLYRHDNGSARSKISYRLTEGLHFTVSAGADLYGFSGIHHENQKYGASAGFKGRTVRDNQRTFNFASNQIITWDKQAGSHKISLLAGHENSAMRYNILNATRSGFPFPGLTELAAASVAEGSTSWENNYRIESYLGRLEYQFDERFILSANFRHDGNSIFHEDQRWGSFWGAGVAWRISRESFLRDQRWLTNLKLKASYGQQGNDKIGTWYAYQGLYATGWNNLNYPGLVASRLATPDLTWESLESINLGMEMKLFNQVGLSFEYFIRNNNDLLFARPLPPSTGFKSIDDNSASVQNKGFDLEADIMLISAGRFSWKFDLNLSHFTNKITELPVASFISGNKRWAEGYSIYEYFIPEWAGVNPNTGMPRWYKDKPVIANGAVYHPDRTVKTTENRTLTENYAEASRYYAGSAIPDLTGGVNNHFRIFGLEVSALVVFSIGGKVYDNSYSALMHSGQNNGYSWHTDILERWTPDNRETGVPILNGTLDGANVSTRFLTDASYLVLKNASVGYHLPGSWIAKTGARGINLYVAGNNLAMLTKRKGLVPAQNFSGNTGNDYVPVRTLSAGINIQF